MTMTIGLLAIWLAYTVYEKLTGAPKTTLREDWDEVRESVSALREARAQEREQRWEPQMAPEPTVHEYPAISAPPPAPSTTAENYDTGLAQDLGF